MTTRRSVEWSRKGAACCLALACAAPAGRAQEVSYADFLRQMVDLAWLATPPQPGERGYQFSSYERASDKGPGDPEAWFANHDRDHYLREEEVEGRTEYVMAECDGPGAIVRIWSANPKGDLRLYVDGALALEMPFAELCSGERAPFLAPLCGMRSRGANCHVPVPFQQHVKVTATAGDLYYHVNVRQLPEGTRVPSFSPDLLEAQSAALEIVRAALSHPARLFPASEREPETFEIPVAPGVRRTLASFPGPGTLRRLAFQVVTPHAREVLRTARLQITYDDQETPAVDCPLGDFFGVAPDWAPSAGYPLGITDDGTAYCHFPMPVRRSLRVEVLHEGSRPFTIRGEMLFQKGPVAPDALYFHAGWRLGRDLPTQPRSDFRVLDAPGRGRFVGAALAVRNPVLAWWGEGDERFYVDGENFPSTFGTGTEDYFGYAWCCQDLFRHAYHNQPRCDGPKNYGYTSLNRFHVLDHVPFQRSFRFDLELWHWVDCQVDLATVAYWYSDQPAGPAVDVPAAQRIAPPLEPYRVFTVENALEGEELEVLSMSGGAHEVQDLLDHGNLWSQGKHLWWRDGKPGDRLELRFPVAEAGRHELRAQLTRAVDYAVVQLALDGEPLGEPVDLYHDGVVPTGELSLGEHDLAAGDHVLSLTLVGANEAAVLKYMAGIDYLLLEPREGGPGTSSGGRKR